MNKLIALCGLVMLGTTTTPQEGNNGLDTNVQEVEVIMTSTGGDSQFAYVMNGPTIKASPELVSNFETESPKELSLDEIIYIEEEVPVELGFNTEDYLPENFNPYEQYVDLNSIEFIEEGEEDSWDLGFDASVYLPDNFNPYAIPGDAMSIDYIEEGEDDVDLGFDTSEYLPEGFDPYDDDYVDLDSIEFYDDDELGPNFWTVDEILNL